MNGASFLNGRKGHNFRTTECKNSTAEGNKNDKWRKFVCTHTPLGSWEGGVILMTWTIPKLSKYV